MSQDIKNVVAWLKNWFYEKSEVYTKSETYTKEEVNSSLANKVNVSQGSGNSDKNIVTNSSGNITTENKITAGSGLSLSNTNQLSHSNSVSAQTTAVLKKIKYDAEGHITETANVDDSDLPSHSHATTSVTNTETYSNLGSNLTNQKLINDAINSKIGTLENISFIEVVTTKPTPSASTMGKLYVVSENSKVNVYYTKRSGSSSNYTYSLQKMDTDILDELVLNWNDIQNKPQTFTPSAHTHNPNEINANWNVYFVTSLPNASEWDTNGLYLLKNGNTFEMYVWQQGSGGSGDYGSLVKKATINDNHTHTLSDITNFGNYVTSIDLMPKGTNPNADEYGGVIRLYFGDEPAPYPSFITLGCNKAYVVKNNAVTLTATITDNHSQVMSGETVTFKVGSSTIGTATTNSSGIATYNYTPTIAGTVSITATAGSVSSSSVSLRVKNNNTTNHVSVLATPNPALVNQNVSISMFVTDADGDPVPNRSVYSYDGTTLQGTTNSEGVYTEGATLQFTSSGTYSFGYTVDGISGTVSIVVNNS